MILYVDCKGRRRKKIAFLFFPFHKTNVIFVFHLLLYFHLVSQIRCWILLHSCLFSTFDKNEPNCKNFPSQQSLSEASKFHFSTIAIDNLQCTNFSSGDNCLLMRRCPRPLIPYIKCILPFHRLSSVSFGR